MMLLLPEMITMPHAQLKITTPIVLLSVLDWCVAACCLPVRLLMSVHARGARAVCREKDGQREREKMKEKEKEKRGSAGAPTHCSAAASDADSAHDESGTAADGVVGDGGGDDDDAEGSVSARVGVGSAERDR
jgi:hypothetical protein